MPFPQARAGVALPSASRTADTFSGVISADRGQRGLRVIVNVTVADATGGVVYRIQTLNPATGGWLDLLASAAIVAAGATILTVYPGIPAVANAAASTGIGRSFRIFADHTDADPTTYSVAYELLP